MRVSPVQELFEAAAELEPGEWREFLEGATGDSGLRETVFELLESARRSPDFLMRPTLDGAGNAVADGPLPGLAEGGRVGRFLLVRRLGAGGGGVVFLARQDEPLVREVAVKILRNTLDDAELRWRFEIERQAISRMNHPGIARVLDAGLTADDRPWLAMEFVPGEPIDAWCDARRLPPEQRAKLVAEVCDAVHHAHQKGVIHRDLKPNNILVAENPGGSPRPWIIDFGIARLTDGDPARTVAGRHPGTPAYMSPEQILGDPAGIDARTDIFSLGVILYELLAGGSPFRQPAARQREAVSPSRLSRETEDGRAAEIAAERALSPAAWRRAMRGDLGKIALKCLRENPAERYPSASALAADLRAFSVGRPVTAQRPSARYLAGKFLRRHPFGSAAAAAALVLLAAAGAAILAAERTAVRERRQAVAERRRAEEMFAGFSRLIMRGNPEYGQPHDYRLRDAVIDFSQDLPAELRSDPLTEARARHTLGSALYGMGEHEMARREFDRALELAGPLPSTETAEMLPLLRFGAAVEMADRDPAAARKLFATVERQLADSPDPDRRALRVRALCQISMIDADNDHFAQAATEAERAVALAETLAVADPELLARGLWTLARVEKSQGRLDRARLYQARRLEILEKSAGPDNPVTWEARADLATLDLAGPRTEAALATLEEISGKMARHFGDAHPSALAIRIEYARALAAMRPVEAAGIYREVIAGAGERCDPEDIARWREELHALE